MNALDNVFERLEMFLLVFILAFLLVTFLLIESKTASHCSKALLNSSKVDTFLELCEISNFLLISGQVFEQEYSKTPLDAGDTFHQSRA